MATAKALAALTRKFFPCAEGRKYLRVYGKRPAREIYRLAPYRFKAWVLYNLDVTSQETNPARVISFADLIRRSPSRADRAKVAAFKWPKIAKALRERGIKVR